MATLTRRLQVLLDEERFERLQTLAERRDTTVAELVRDALDRAYPSAIMTRQEAAERFLARPPNEALDGSWEDYKREIEAAYDRHG